VDENCNQLEMELMRKRPDWMNKRHKYALLTEGRVVICLARRHLDALKWLQVLLSRSNAILFQDRNNTFFYSKISFGSRVSSHCMPSFC
jgi:hypothetical protein